MASVSTSPVGAAVGADRLPWLDLVKGGAIALVVFNHALLWPMRAGSLTAAFLYGTCYGTVAAFAAVSGYISGRRPIGDRCAFVRRRARQILVPWAVWAPLYALAPFAAGALGGKMPVATEPVAWTLAIALGGGALWFLPVLFAATATATWLDGRTGSWWPFAAGVGSYAVIAGIAFAAFREPVSPLAFGRGTLWATWPLYLASYWFGLRLARGAFAHGSASQKRWPWLTLLIASTLAAGASTLLREVLGIPWLSWTTYLAGAVGGWAALVLAIRESRGPGRVLGPLVTLGALSLGVYVMHPLVLGPVMFALGDHATLTAALVAAIFAVAAASGLVRAYRSVRAR